MKLWLDDIREAPEGWVHVTTVEECIDYLSMGADIEAISLDNDLGICTRQGYKVMDSRRRKNMSKKLNREEMNKDIERVVSETKLHHKLTEAEAANMRRGLEQMRDLCLLLDTACDELDAFAMGYTVAAQPVGRDGRLPN